MSYTQIVFGIHIIALVFLTVMGSQTVYADEIRFYTHGVEGKVYRTADGVLRGIKHSGRRAFQIELVREMMTRLKISPQSMRIVPFKRGLRLITDSNKQAAFFNVIYLPEREPLMKFVGPLTNGTTSIYERTSAPTGIKSIDDAKKQRLCLLRGSGQDSFAVKNTFSKIIRHDYEGCFKMLMRGHTDLVVASDLDLRSILATAGIEPDLIKNTNVDLYTTVGSLAFSNLVPDEVVRRWQMALDDIKTSGRYDELMRDYLYPE